MRAESRGNASLGVEPHVKFVDRPKVSAAIKEIKAIRPRVVFETYFSRHSTLADAAPLGEKISKCDIFVPEYHSWDSSHFKLFNELSRGEVYLGSDDLFMQGLIGTMYGKNKSVTLIDYPAGHPSENDESSDDIRYSEISFEEALRQRGEQHKKINIDDVLREEYMVEQLPLRLNEALESNPLLKQKDQINTLLFLGAGHTRVHHVLRTASPESVRHFPQKPFVYPPLFEELRSYEYGKRASDKLAAQSLMTQMLPEKFKLMKDLGDSPDVSAAASSLRAFVSQFSVDEVRDIYNNWRNIETETEEVEIFKTVFQKKGLSPKGLPKKQNPPRS
jgi:hypothetical protein